MAARLERRLIEQRRAEGAEKKGAVSGLFCWDCLRPLRLFASTLFKYSTLWLGCQFASAATLQIEITPRISGEILQPASLRYQTSAGEAFSVTRVSYLVSDFALQRNDGSWQEFPDTIAWLDFEASRNSLRLENVPAGDFRSVRFSIGLNPNLNHDEVAQFPAGHPLNPNLNGLHWSWQGGYIFLALEGLWRNSAGELDGWAYHLARDTNCTRVTLAAPLEITGETRLELDFELGRLLNAPRPLSFGKDGSSTHSRDGDPVSAALVKNLAGAFRVRKITALSTSELAAASPKPLFLPEKYTPQPFQMSATFPVPDLPRDNPLTAERVELGRKLFFDKQLSVNNSQSCADCHSPERAFTDGLAQSRGAEGAFGTRNAMPLFNLAWKRSFFWDGRASSLREQVLQPIQNPIEMHQVLTKLVTTLQSTGDYPAFFAAAFGSVEITSQKLALALENYLLTLTSFDSKFDRTVRGQEKLTDDEQRGFELFSTEYDPRRGQFGADCFHCHGGPLFQSQGFANNGLDEHGSDPGRAKVTSKGSDHGKFAVPSLRNIALTGPYMHDGRFKTLEEVIEHYTTGVKRSATLDPNLAKHPDGGVPLNGADKRAVVAFLKTLTDEKFLRTNIFQGLAYHEIR
ncbi:MAG TPA: MbnP family protein [Candidatus Binatia bacterium]|jgi:cytochrome c peroxidase|nr:MbnP family protein [Candidatus Binatia bacterium]